MRTLKGQLCIASAGAFLLSLSSLHANFTDLSGLNGKKVVLQKDYHLQYIDSTKGGEKLLWHSNAGQELCAPAKIPLKWYWNGIMPRSYTVELSTTPDFKQKKTFVTDINMVEVENLLLDTVYYWRVSATVKGKKTVSPVWKFRTTDLPPRWIRAEGVGNLRDIGGWKVPGGKIKQGMVYRGTRMDKAPWLITKKGLDVVVNDLKLRSELDLRHVPKGKPPLKPLGVNITNFGYGSYAKIFDRKDQCEMTVKLLKKFTDPAYFPVYIHCDGGADRTGIFLFFLESVLGMSEADLLLEYELTTFFQPRHRDSKQMKPFLEAIRKYGKPEDTLAAKAVAFLKQYGLTDDDINDIKNNLTQRGTK